MSGRMKQLRIQVLALLPLVLAGSPKGKQGVMTGENLEGLLRPGYDTESPHSTDFVPRAGGGDLWNFGRVHAALEHVLEAVPEGDIYRVPLELQEFSDKHQLKLVPPLGEEVIELAMQEAAVAAGLQLYPTPQKKLPDPGTEFPEDARGIRMLVLDSGIGTFELRSMPLLLRIPKSPIAIHEVVSLEEAAHYSNTGSQLIQHAIGEKHFDVLRHLPLVPSEETTLEETLESLQETYELPSFDLVVLSGGDRDKQTKQVEALLKSKAVHNGTVVSAHGPGRSHVGTGRYLQALEEGGKHAFTSQVHDLSDGTAAILSALRLRERQEL
mmetsp:Transcript_50697/g.94708  ORF Transcript_50697/g.94708 Transcript_50697/m.94708 type:complete len:326 (+) Transcript_50697:69-1046(+)